MRSARDVATFIREVELTLDEPLGFRPGAFVQLEVPAYEALPFAAFDLAPAARAVWEAHGLLGLTARNPAPTTRAYSVATAPAEEGHLALDVRIATPPPGSDHPPGVASSFVYSLRPGDRVWLTGPHGEFFPREGTREMVYVGGGAGMAPLRSHIVHLLREARTRRKVTFFYGARSRSEVFYEETFRQLEREFPNFRFVVALSAPLAEDAWEGPVGFIHEVARRDYLAEHPDPGEVDYYLCGPPPMMAAVCALLADLGVEPGRVACDAF